MNNQLLETVLLLFHCLSLVDKQVSHYSNITSDG